MILTLSVFSVYSVVKKGFDYVCGKDFDNVGAWMRRNDR